MYQVYSQEEKGYDKYPKECDKKGYKQEEKVYYWSGFCTSVLPCFLVVKIMGHVK